jgi:hypothetical protein
MGKVSLPEAWLAVDVPTIALLFGLMVVSAQFRLGGFYTRLTRQLAAAEVAPERLLALLVAIVGGLAALLANDIVCLAMAPVLAEGCARRGLDPKPFLLALALAANVGSAATLIGNPQNMLIGQALQLSFAGYLLDAGIPARLQRHRPRPVAGRPRHLQLEGHVPDHHGGCQNSYRQNPHRLQEQADERHVPADLARQRLVDLRHRPRRRQHHRRVCAVVPERHPQARLRGAENKPG